MDHDYFVYLLSDNDRSTLYIGMTNNLQTRLWQHRNPERPSFTQRYHCIILVHYEHFPDVLAAIAREKQLKGWTRAKKKCVGQGAQSTLGRLVGGLGVSGACDATHDT